jgi:uncharacterized protein (TIGR00255 family)
LLLSMTGFGEARTQDPGRSVLVEVRTVNNRHLKVNTKISDELAVLEPNLEAMVRERIRRGTVHVIVRVERPRRSEDYRLNLVALASYRDQLLQLPGAERFSLDLARLASLPGVIEEQRTPDRATEEEWGAISSVVSSALDQLEAARTREGNAMATELIALAGTIGDRLAQVADRAPLVVQAYHKKLTERVRALLSDHGLTIEPGDLVREVAILADRSDITEEMVRLRAHLTEFAAIIQLAESSGRKLEFITQEMGREVNTIGSKANDIEISRAVVDMKAVLEKIRELIQNVE